jgi:hypothetical protein
VLLTSLNACIPLSTSAATPPLFRWPLVFRLFSEFVRFASTGLRGKRSAFHERDLLIRVPTPRSDHLIESRHWSRISRSECSWHAATPPGLRLSCGERHTLNSRDLRSRSYTPPELDLGLILHSLVVTFSRHTSLHLSSCENASQCRCSKSLVPLRFVIRLIG